MKRENIPSGTGGENTEALLTEIAKSARTEADGILEDARKTAQQKADSAQAQAERIKREAREKAEERSESIRTSRMATLEVQKKRIRLHQQEELMQLVLKMVLENIKNKADTDEYRQVFIDWASEASMGLGTDSALLEISPSEKHLATDAVLREIKAKTRVRGGPDMQLAFSEETHPGTGIIARSPDRRLLYDNRAETRIQRHQNVIRKVIYRELIEKDSG
jgi:V/A-type H+/Na+-transporting ATPase subunit E